MPPTRTIPPVKAVRTERTHEENQERAYIAASRRSDRSLEARVESARRASEIHKRRTGRSLRVTEQDVINEEMYEEEDDDLPMQYRRLTAHLQTGSVDFNRRLAAYLTNQVAMRSAMEQMVNNSYNQQYPNAAQFAQNRLNMFPSPIAPQSLTPSPTTSFRHAPYHNPHHQSFHQQHGRAYSTAAVPANTSSTSPPTPSAPNHGLANRRLSTPAILQPSSSLDGTTQDSDYQRQAQSATMANFPPLWQDMGPFTTTLPPETQQMLAPALDPSDPFSATLMGGSENYMSNFYSWGQPQQFSGKPGQPQQYAFGGMATTLAPSALDTSAVGLSVNPTSATQMKSDTSSAPSSGLDFNFSQETKGYSGFTHSGIVREGSQGLASGQVTPGDGFWDSFVHDDGGWSEESATG